MAPTPGPRYRSLLPFLLLSFTGTATAHIDYVREGTADMTTQQLIAGVISDPFNIVLLTAAPLLAAALIYGIRRSEILHNDIEALQEALADDASFVPLLLRLSIGIPLVGAGYMGYLFTPVVQLQLRLVLIGLGFFILFGLATRFMAGVGLLLYLAMLPQHPDMVLAVEFVPGFLAIILMGSGRPSADHVLARLAGDESTLYSRIDPVYDHLMQPFRARVDRYRDHLPVLLRGGLGIAFIYLGVAEKLLEPGEAIAVVHKYGLTAVVPVSPELWVVGAALTEIGIGLLLLSGLYTRVAAGTAFFMFTVTLFGLPDDPVLPHTSLFGLVAVLIIVGAGPVSLDTRLGASDRAATKLREL